MIQHYPLFIDGKFRQTTNKQKIVNPSSGEVITEVSLCAKKDIEDAISAARRAFDSGPWKDISLEERKKFLLKISEGILEKAGELAKLETLNTGKPIKETTFMDIPSAAKTFEHLANNLENYLMAQTINVSEEEYSRLVYEPRGVAVLIVPWNYPLLIASWKLASALAAGNTVILKPSSLTPLTVLELAKIIADSGIPNGVVNIINGSGRDIGQPLCSDRRIDMISFTGSNESGRHIMQYASENIKKVIMELGGKSASIILKDADLEVAVNGSLCSIFLNQGQMCTAMSRIFVHSDIYDIFLERFIEKVKRIKLGSGLDYEAQMGPLISRSHRESVLGYVNKAKREGARLLYGGNIPDEPKLKNGFFLQPTVFGDVPSESSIFNEEVFGPVACLNRFSDEEEALALANKSDFALAACIWTKDVKRAQDLAAKINAGTVWINTYGMFYNELPYGGFKQSGFGKELGREGLLEYSRLKNIISNRKEDYKPIVNHWYGF